MPDLYPSEHLYLSLAEKHGHRCPMSTLGLRLGFAARELAPKGSTSFRYGKEDCSRDGVLHALRGVSQEIIPVEQGHHQAEILKGETVLLRIALSDYALAVAWEYRTFSENLECQTPDLSPEEREKGLVAKGELLEEIITRIKAMPAGHLLTILPEAV